MPLFKLTGEIFYGTNVAAGSLNGRDVLITSGNSSSSAGSADVYVWDVADSRLSMHIRGSGGQTQAVALGKLAGRPVVVTGNLNGMVVIWDLSANPHTAATGVDVGSPVRSVATHDSPNYIIVRADAGVMRLTVRPERWPVQRVASATRVERKRLGKRKVGRAERRHKRRH